MVAGLAVLIVAACYDGTPEDKVNTAQSFTLRDSAGIQIAESADSAWTGEDHWRIKPEPLLQIGSVAGNPPGSDFGDIGSIIRFADGRIGVADRQGLQIRVFGSDGRFLEAWGGAGAGPGEFQRLDGLALIGDDSLVARNDGVFRHDIFAPDGNYARTVRAPPASWLGRGGSAAGWLKDGSFMIGPVNVPRAVDAVGRHLRHGEWHLFDGTGRHVGLVARLPERMVELKPGASGPVPVSYGARAHVAGSVNGVWHGFSDSFELRHIGARGVDRIIRRSWTPEAVPEPVRAEYVEWYRRGESRLDVDPALLPEVAMLRRLDAVQTGDRATFSFAETFPAFAGIIEAADGHVWVQQAATAAELRVNPTRLSSSRWTVFDPAGRWLGSVVMPPDLHVRAVAADHVVGVWKDPLDVQHVRLHRLIRR